MWTRAHTHTHSRSHTHTHTKHGGRHMAWERERKCRMFEGVMKEWCLDLGGKHVDLSSDSTADSPPSDVSAISAWFANSAIPWRNSRARTEFSNRFQLHSSNKVPIEKENKLCFCILLHLCVFFSPTVLFFKEFGGLKIICFQDILKPNYVLKEM